MSDPELTPECSLAEHSMCHGPQEIRLADAPAWQVPVLTVRCGCACHKNSRSRLAARRPGR
ncbi:hypothetical protein ACPCTG_26535 [Streptomyces pseudogriseolus]|uniref:hypothetical protein n=1 Tax=Streptomyces pseudogriseolus TaxID=36817 RepID=UPI003FA256A0